MKYRKNEIAESRAALLGWLTPGMTVYTILDSVSRSGMCRHIRLLTLEGDGPRYLSYHAARVLGYAINGHSDAIRITGCGMDMGFAIVYELSSALGYALNQRWL
jgi:hypothetical protein